MRKHLLWIMLLLLIIYLVPDLLAMIPEMIRSGELRSTAEKYFNIFTLTSFLSFTYAAVAFFLLFYYRYAKDKKIVFIAELILTLLSFIFFRYLLEELVMPALTGYRNYAAGTTVPYYIGDNFLFGVIYGGLGIVYYFIQRSNKSEKEKQALMLEKQQAELSFLRSQINPHFLFNSLNNIYALVYHRNEQSLAAIQKLSTLLRYILYAKENEVPVLKEVEYIQDYIDLELMRHERKNVVQMHIDVADEQLTIAPLLLLPFVENAFKHGNLQDAEPITIHCETAGKSLSFRVRNAKANKQRDASGGVGLSNIKRRLALLYPSRHNLEIADTPGHFAVNLQIAL